MGEKDREEVRAVLSDARDHSGAIKIFKRTGPLHNLQRAMGH